MREVRESESKRIERAMERRATEKELREGDIKRRERGYRS